MVITFMVGLYETLQLMSRCFRMFNLIYISELCCYNMECMKPVKT